MIVSKRCIFEGMSGECISKHWRSSMERDPYPMLSWGREVIHMLTLGLVNWNPKVSVRCSDIYLTHFKEELEIQQSVLRSMKYHKSSLPTFTTNYLLLQNWLGCQATFVGPQGRRLKGPHHIQTRVVQSRSGVKRNHHQHVCTPKLCLKLINVDPK
jgi:hypothetical protein